MKVFWMFVLLCVWAVTLTADDRLWVAARINGKPAYLIFDTGAGRTALFRKGAERLGLKSAWPPVNWASVSNAVTAGTTEETLFELGSANLLTWFEVMEVPAYANFKGDGLLAWEALDVDLLQIDADNSIVKPLAKLPRDLASWQRFRLLDGAQVLVLEVSEKNNKPNYVYLDTGGGFGVNLNPTAWHQWRAAHTNQPVSAVSYYAADAGFVVMEQAWADEMNLGPIRLTGVPVSEANSAEIAQGSSGYVATLGIAAIRRLDLIIDRRQGCAYMRPKTTAPWPYDHNRTGAAVEPKDSGKIVIAHVVKGSPADQAGVRAGDVLLKDGGRDVSNWHAAPLFFESENAPDGTRLNLTLERDATEFTTTLVLRDLIGPSSRSLKTHRNRPGPPPQRTNDFSRFKVAIRLRRPDVEDYNWRGFIYESNSRFDEAISNYSRAIQLDARSAEAYLFRGRCFANNGNFALAIRDSQQAVSLQPTNDAAELALAYVYCQQSNWDNAIAACGEAIRLNPGKAENHWRRAAAYQGKGDLHNAVEDYSYAVRLDPKATAAYYGRGQCYFDRGDVDLAIDDFTKALALNPSNAELYRSRGYAYIQHGELYLAVSDLSEAIRLQPTNAWTYETRGYGYARRKEWEKAFQDYSEALRLNPGDAAALTGRGIALLEKRDFEQADSDFKQAVILSPQDPSTYRNVAWLEATCSLSSGRNGAAAVKAGRKACELTDWKDAGALTALAAASAEIGDFENAVMYEQKGLALDGLSEQERKTMGERLLLYQEHKPYHQPGRE